MAAWERKVQVRVMGSHWSHTRTDMPAFLASLQALTTANHTTMDVQAVNNLAFLFREWVLV